MLAIELYTHAIYLAGILLGLNALRLMYQHFTS